MLIKLSLYFHTIKFIRFVQIFYRIYYRFHKVKVCGLNEYTNNDLNYKSREWKGNLYSHQSIFNNESALFLNKKVDITSNLIWNDDSQNKLWLYNLHYMDDLNSIGSNLRSSQQLEFVRRWIEENPAVIGNGWEPYPLSLRLVNLIKWFWSSGIDDFEVYQSIAQQADALRQQPEYHIQANHLFANAKALVFCGSFLNNKLGHDCLELGLSILNKEIPVQFLDDGAHYELSPMYHSVMLWDMLELYELSILVEKLNIYSENWLLTCMKGLDWLESMCHPDEQICFFNDAAFCIAADPVLIKEYAFKLGIVGNNLKDFTVHNVESGYTKVYDNGASLFFNHAEISPNFQPGHAHADSLSFELSLGEKRVLVNSGTSTYVNDSTRDYERSTSAHNTVVVDNKNSTEVWGGFRVARRAKIFSVNHKNQDVTAMCRHVNGALHCRSISLNNGVFISDTITHKGGELYAFFHFHPDCTVHRISVNSWNVLVENYNLVVSFSSDESSLISSFWRPQFGLKIISQSLKVKFNGNLDTEMTWLINE